MVKNMKNEMKNENRDDLGAIGIGAMIVFIALILVAAVASAVIIQTAEKLQQNAQSTGEDTTDMMAGKIFINSVVLTNAGADLYITFELAPGSDPIDPDAVEYNLICLETGHERVQQPSPGTSERSLVSLPRLLRHSEPLVQLTAQPCNNLHCDADAYGRLCATDQHRRHLCGPSRRRRIHVRDLQVRR